MKKRGGVAPLALLLMRWASPLGLIFVKFPMYGWSCFYAWVCAKYMGRLNQLVIGKNLVRAGARKPPSMYGGRDQLAARFNASLKPADTDFSLCRRSTEN